MNLETFLDRLDAADGPLELVPLQALLRQLDCDDSSFADAWSFSTDSYQRNLLRRNRHYEAILLCFEAGQRTPIHDHLGSACGVRVISGVASETAFQKTADGWMFATGNCDLPAGGVVGSVDTDVHQLSNLQENGARLATLHIYSPPLQQVGNYDIVSNRVTMVSPVVQTSSMTRIVQPSAS